MRPDTWKRRLGEPCFVKLGGIAKAYAMPGEKPWQTLQRLWLLEILLEHGGDVSRVAEALGVKPVAIYERIGRVKARLTEEAKP
jgi:DNA-binding NtrC family response regulator